MKQYELVLKNEKRIFYNRITWIIVFVQVIAFIYLSLFASSKPDRISSIATLILIAIGFSLKYYFRKTPYRFGLTPFLFVFVLGWVNIGQFWIAAMSLLFEVLSFITLRKTIVVVSGDKISYPSFPVKNIQWGEISNSMLKDGLLTIDMKNNKIIQQYIDESIVAINEKEFNEFCTQQLNKADSRLPIKDS